MLLLGGPVKYQVRQGGVDLRAEQFLPVFLEHIFDYDSLSWHVSLSYQTIIDVPRIACPVSSSFIKQRFLCCLINRSDSLIRD